MECVKIEVEDGVITAMVDEFLSLQDGVMQHGDVVAIQSFVGGQMVPIIDINYYYYYLLLILVIKELLNT